MYRIKFEYADGRKGICTEDGIEITFENKNEAEAYSLQLNESVAPELKDFFPVWSAENI